MQEQQSIRTGWIHYVEIDADGVCEQSAHSDVHIDFRDKSCPKSLNGTGKLDTLQRQLQGCVWSARGVTLIRNWNIARGTKILSNEVLRHGVVGVCWSVVELRRVIVSSRNKVEWLEVGKVSERMARCQI